jgi:hypothetical protein
MKNMGVLLLALVLIFTLTACYNAELESADVVSATQPTSGAGEGASAASDATQIPQATARPISVEYDSDDLDSSTL